MKIKNKLIVGIIGKMGSGKDTIASQLHGFKTMRFADALKETACLLFGWCREDLEDLNFKMATDLFWGEAPRTLLQRLGTEAMRKGIREDIWVKILEQRIQLSTQERIAITDVRFPNEAEAVLDWGGYLVKVERPGFIPPNITPEQLKHPSETALDDYDKWTMCINNAGSLDNLISEAVRVGRVLENFYADRTANKTS